MADHFSLEDLLARVRAGEQIDFDSLEHTHPAQREVIARAREISAAKGTSPTLGAYFHHPREPVRYLDATDFKPGRILDDFRLEYFLGRGGMGQVWVATQLSLQRRVALKFIRSERLNDRSRELFAREARAGGRIQHPGVVAVHGLGEVEGMPCIVMDYVEGACNLSDSIAWFRKLAEQSELPKEHDRKVAELVATVAEAMDAVHAHVIHRDLKPQNILITPNDQPRIADFGLARVLGDDFALSQTGDFAGTYFYMSPEQVAAKRMGMDRRSDVFSLGAVLYELLTLRTPFTGDSPQQICEQILTKDPQDPRTIRSRIPRDLAVIAGKALEKDRDRRFQTMTDFAADLRRFLTNQPIQARGPTSLDSGLKWVRRHPTASTAGTLTLCALATVSWFATRLSEANTLNQSRAQAEERLKNEALAREREGRMRGLVLSVQYFQSLDDDLIALDSPFGRPSMKWWVDAARELLEGVKEDTHNGVPLQPGLRDVDRELARVSAMAEPDKRASFRGNGGSGSHVRPRFKRNEDGWWYGQLVSLSADLHAISRELEFAEQSIHGDGAAAAWSAAIQAITSSAKYHHAQWPNGKALTPQLGLVPIGADPDSGLWEFAHLATGVLPKRDDTGRLVRQPEMGVVFVLLPGGRVPRPSSPNEYQGDSIQGVSLDPFFISKYEMTYDQWVRLRWRVADNVVRARPTLDPVHSISWDDCRESFSAQSTWIGMPTEAQWECACRAGSSSDWAALGESDQRRMANYGPKSGDRGLWSRDVGSYMPNEYGLFDMRGNVAEWCADALPLLTKGVPAEGRNGDGLVAVCESPYFVEYRALRGGAFCDPADALSASRQAYARRQDRVDQTHLIRKVRKSGRPMLPYYEQMDECGGGTHGVRPARPVWP